MVQQIEKGSWVLISAFAILVYSCGTNDNGEKADADRTSVSAVVYEVPIGIGPVKKVDLTELDPQMAQHGQEVFESKCTACHKLEVRHVGPALKGITSRRGPEWIMNMILNPEVMVKEDETARELLGEYIAPMANQGLTQDEARALLEYFRSKDNQE